MKHYSNEDIEDAIIARDAARLKQMANDGLDPGWMGTSGRTLLHAAARLGDEELVDALLAKGSRTRVYNNEMESPLDVAIAWGHDAIAKKIAAAMEKEPAPAAAPLPYKSLQDIRDKSAETGISQFHYLAATGRFGDVIALAGKDSGGLAAADLLGKGPDGNTALLKICEKGQLGQLLQPEIWARNPKELQAVWERVPEDYRKGFDFATVMNRARQARLQSYVKSHLKDFKL